MRHALLAVGILVFAANTLPAADGQPATVSGVGSSEIKRPAEILRVRFDVMARGKNLADAVEKLKARREVVAAELVKLGASKDSVSFGDTDVVDEANERQAQIDRMLGARNRAPGKAPKPKTDTPTVLFVPLRADFPLPADKPDALLVVAKTLQEKIRAAELGGVKVEGKATPEEEEQAEEAGGGGRGEQPRGTPSFLFVFKLTEAERAKALADAFALAKADAARLAKAAGMGLGDLQRLADQTQPGMDQDDIAQMLSRRDYGYGRFGGDSSSGYIVGNEAVGGSLNRVAVKVGVIAQFKLVPSK